MLEEVIARIACAKASVPTACEGICSPASFWRRLTEDPSLQESYARAAEARAHVRYESIDAVLGSLLAGKIDAHTARVMVDTIKWQCGREKPKRYGDKVAVESTGADGGPVAITVEYINKPSPSADPQA